VDCILLLLRQLQCPTHRARQVSLKLNDRAVCALSAHTAHFNEACRARLAPREIMVPQAACRCAWRVYLVLIGLQRIKLYNVCLAQLANSILPWHKCNAKHVWPTRLTTSLGFLAHVLLVRRAPNRQLVLPFVLVRLVFTCHHRFLQIVHVWRVPLAPVVLTVVRPARPPFWHQLRGTGECPPSLHWHQIPYSWRVLWVDRLRAPAAPTALVGSDTPACCVGLVLWGFTRRA
jgi:hypothetical protein